MNPIVVALGVEGVPRIVLGILAVVFPFGYAAIAAVFPAAGEIDWTRRITLSIVVSLAAVPPAGLLAYSTPWGREVETVLAILAIGTISACLFAHRRRLSLPVDRRLSLTLEMRPLRWRNASPVQHVLLLGLAASVVAASALFVQAGPRPAPPGFTEFFLLNETGVPAGYPSNLSVGQEATVILVVRNHERSALEYSIDIWLSTLERVINQTSGLIERVERARVSLQTLSIQVGAGEQERIPYQIRIDQPGEYALKFSLFVGPPAETPYRRAELRITVI